MVAKKVSTMDILYHQSPTEEEDPMIGQNKERFIQYYEW